MTSTEPLLDEDALIRAVSVAGPDRPELVDPDRAQLLAELAELDQRVAGGEISIGDRLDRQAELFDRLRGQVLLTEPAYGPYVRAIADRFNLGQLLLDAYLPANIPGPVERRYRLQFVSPDVSGFGQVKVASKDTGKVFVLNTFPTQVGFASGRVDAAVGILVKPIHPISRLTFEPSVSYTFGHRADVATAQGNVNSAVSRGELDLVVDRINPVTGAAEPFMRKSVQLWEKYTGTGYGWIHGHGQFPGNNTGLQVIAGSGDLLAMWLIARIDMTKQDHDPQFFSTGQAYLDCDLPLMWVHETPLT